MTSEKDQYNISTSKHFNTNWKSSLYSSFEEYFIIIVFSQVWSLSTRWRFLGSISHQANRMVTCCPELHWTQPWWRNQNVLQWNRSEQRHKGTTLASAGGGRIVVGRWYPDQDQNYTSVQVDELIYFNASLTSDDVQSIYNSA